MSIENCELIRLDRNPSQKRRWFLCDDDDDEIAYFNVRWKTRSLI